MTIASLIAPIIGSSKKSTGKTIKVILQELGFDDELLSLWAAADYNSYSGTGNWNDVGPAGAHMQRGPTAGTLPVFNGSPGGNSLNEYWAFDGNDKFTLAGGNPTWADTIHQDNANFTMFTIVYFGTGATVGLIGNNAGLTTNVGFGWQINSSTGQQVFLASTGSAYSFNQNWTLGGIALSTWYFCAISLNEATGAAGVVWARNGTTDNSDPSTYTSPAAGSATLGIELGTRGAASVPLTAGSRMHCMAVLNRALSAAELGTLNTALQAARGY